MPFRKLRIVLIKPSKYDDDGYVIRFWKGVLPSNTLNVLHGLTEEVKSSGVFGGLRIEIVTFDETAEKLPVRNIIRWSRRPSTKLVVGLVGVQTNQFPRAFDLGRRFRAAGIDVIMGGFHASGRNRTSRRWSKNPSRSYRVKSRRTGRRSWRTRSMVD
jgi:hypothetical protein